MDPLLPEEVEVELLDLHADWLHPAPAGFTKDLQAALGPEWVCFWNPNEQVFDVDMTLKMDENPDALLPGDHTQHPRRMQPDRGCWVVYVKTTFEVKKWDALMGEVRYPCEKLCSVYKVNGITNFGRPFGLGQWLIEDLRFSDMKRWGSLCTDKKKWAHREAYLRQWRRESKAMDPVAGDKFINQRLRSYFSANGGIINSDKDHVYEMQARMGRVAEQRAREKQELLKELGL